MKRREPILSVIFRIAGGILIAVAALAALGAMMDRQLGAVALLIGTGSLLLSAAFFFGAAQVITALVETADATKQLVDLERQSLSQQRENAKALQWVVDQSKRGD